MVVDIQKRLLSYCCSSYCCLFIIFASNHMVFILFFFFKQKTAYDMRISDWSSDVCSSDLPAQYALQPLIAAGAAFRLQQADRVARIARIVVRAPQQTVRRTADPSKFRPASRETADHSLPFCVASGLLRSEEHTSELQSLMRISYAVFCLTNKHTNVHSN